jgi:hypothetical protein
MRKRKMIDARKAAKEGKRMYAFYQGFKARRRGTGTNLFPRGSEDHKCWENGWKYAEADDGPA